MDNGGVNMNMKLLWIYTILTLISGVYGAGEKIQDNNFQKSSHVEELKQEAFRQLDEETINKSPIAKRRYTESASITSTTHNTGWITTQTSAAPDIKGNNPSVPLGRDFNFANFIPILLPKLAQTSPVLVPKTVTLNGTIFKPQVVNALDVAYIKPNMNTKIRHSMLTKSDYRPSAIGIGSVGVIVIVAFVFGIVALDSSVLYRHVCLLKKRITRLFKPAYLQKCSPTSKTCFKEANNWMNV